jgi:hypothetical protein
VNTGIGFLNWRTQAPDSGHRSTPAIVSSKLTLSFGANRAETHLQSPARAEVRLGNLLNRFADTARRRNGDALHVELDLSLGEDCTKDNLLEVDQCRGTLFSAHPQKGTFPAVQYKSRQQS